MAASLSEIKCVNIDGLKATWRVPQKDIVDLDGTIFIRINPQNAGLVALVSEANDAAPDPVPRQFSLTACSSLHALTKIRNDTQAKELNNSPAACNLFEPVAEAAAKRIKQSRKALPAMRTDLESISIDLEAGEDEPVHTKVLRPVHPTDGIFVEYEAETLSKTIKYIRRCSFTEEQTRHDTTLPKGIWRRPGGVFLVSIVVDGTRKFITTRSLEDAKAVLAGGTIPSILADSGAPDDANEADA